VLISGLEAKKAHEGFPLLTLLFAKRQERTGDDSPQQSPLPHCLLERRRSEVAEPMVREADLLPIHHVLVDLEEVVVTFTNGVSLDECHPIFQAPS
jgi:hypothetical protein